MLQPALSGTQKCTVPVIPPHSLDSESAEFGHGVGVNERPGSPKWDASRPEAQEEHVVLGIPPASGVQSESQASDGWSALPIRTRHPSMQSLNGIIRPVENPAKGLPDSLADSV